MRSEGIAPVEVGGSILLCPKDVVEYCVEYDNHQGVGGLTVSSMQIDFSMYGVSTDRSLPGQAETCTIRVHFTKRTLSIEDACVVYSRRRNVGDGLYSYEISGLASDCVWSENCDCTDRNI